MRRGKTNKGNKGDSGDGKNKMDGQAGAQKSEFILHKPKTAEPPEFSGLDNFLIKAGAKHMTTPKTTSPLEWNKSVVGLTASIIVLIMILVGGVWNYASLSTKYERTQTDIQELKDKDKELQIKYDLKIAEIEKKQYQNDLMQERINGFKAGVAETQSK